MQSTRHLKNGDARKRIPPSKTPPDRPVGLASVTALRVRSDLAKVWASPLDLVGDYKSPLLAFSLFDEVFCSDVTFSA